jgi:hypothetical protein
MTSLLEQLPKIVADGKREDMPSIRDMLEFARLRPIDERVQAQFAF